MTLVLSEAEAAQRAAAIDILSQVTFATPPPAAPICPSYTFTRRWVGTMQLAQRLYELQNLHGVVAVVASLMHPAIKRLHQSWALVRC